MSTVLTTIFKNNKTQAVRLPKAVEIAENIKEVVITSIGNTRIISPKEQAWDIWFNTETVTEDFMLNRVQEEQLREDL